MTGPIRPTSTPPTASRPPAAGQPQTPARGAGAGRALAGPPGLGRAPGQPAPSQGASSSSTQRARLPPPSHTGSSSRAASSSGSGPRLTTPAPQQLSQLAERLSGLEQQRAALAARLAEAKEARQAKAGKSGSAANRAELVKLQDRLSHATDQLERLRVGRGEQLGRLERTERLLESCERSLQALSIDETPAARTEAPEPAAAPLAATATEIVAPAAPRISQEETQLQAQVAQLEREADVARTGKARAQQTLAAARNHVKQVEAGVASLLEPASYTKALDDTAAAGLDGYLQYIGLPLASQLPARGEADNRHALYLERFTETDEAGNRRLTNDVLEDPRLAFSAMSAFYSSMSSTHTVDSLLTNLVRGDHWDMSEITAALRNGGQDLESVVRLRIHMGWEHMIELSQMTIDAGANAAIGPRHSRILGTNMRRSEMLQTARRNGEIVQMQQLPMHRATLIDGAVTQACQILRGVIQNHAEAANELVSQAKAELEETMAALRPAFAAPIQADAALAKASKQLEQVIEERHQKEAAEARAARAAAAAAAAARPVGATITQTETASSSSTDAEARRLKLQGDVEKHTEAANGARQGIAQTDEAIRKAEADVRRAEDQLETASAAQARRHEGARRQHGEQREEVGKLRRELAELDGQIEQARTELDQHPARGSLISQRAWDRAVERHVEPDDAALRARARVTGYAGAYSSRADLARATADIHTELSQQAPFQAVLAARTRAEFERAVAQLPPPGSVTDLVHDHGRPVGRGFSNDPDQTARPTELTQSSFSLLFVEGRTVITHLYPYVPHRQLTTAA